MEYFERQFLFLLKSLGYLLTKIFSSQYLFILIFIDMKLIFIHLPNSNLKKFFLKNSD